MDLLKAKRISMNYCSQSIEEVLSAFSKAQGKFKRLSSSGRTPTGRVVTTLSDILACIRESFEANGLSFYQYTEITQDSHIKLLHTRIGHMSGQFISSLSRFIGSETIKETNIALEIEKKVQALMLLGIAPDPLEKESADDDGDLDYENKLVNRVSRDESRTPPDSYKAISELDYQRLMIEIGNDKHIAKSIMKEYKIESIADLPLEVYHKVINEVRRIKKLAEDVYGR